MDMRVADQPIFKISKLVTFCQVACYVLIMPIGVHQKLVLNNDKHDPA